jgi:hypothetical protein
MPVGHENSIPEEVDHREIAVRVQMVDKVKLLFASEPSEACEPRSFSMVLLVKNVRRTTPYWQTPSRQID